VSVESSPLRRAVQLDQLIASLGGEKEIAVMVVDEFLRHVDSQLQAIRVAIENRDGEKIRAAAHRHVGSLTAIHAVPARDMARAVEQAAQMRDIARASEAFQSLLALSKEVVDYLRNWQSEQRR
jgi:HPt (histidine-containing phosphotransfer) domain-containing protein